MFLWHLGWNNPDLLAVCRLYYHVCVKRLWDKICGVSFVTRFMDVCAGFLTNALTLTFLAGMSYFISFFDTTTSKRGFRNKSHAWPDIVYPILSEH